MTSISNLTRSIHELAHTLDGSDIEEIVARSPVATCVATSEEGALLVNQAAADLMGHAAEDLLGRRLLHTFVHPDDIEAVAWVGVVLQTGRTVDVRHRLLSATGEVRHVRASISPIMNDGRMRYAVAQYVDETQLVLAAREVKRQGERHRRFAESVAHDLRSPIATMATAASLLTNQGAMGADEAHELLEMIESASHEAAVVVEQTLSAAIGDPDHSEPLDLVTVVDRVKALLGPTLAAVGGQILVSGTARLVHVDEEALREVLLNLCENAMKYRSDRPPRVVVELDEVGQTLRVIDNGRGMTPEQRERVFERGFQTSAANPGSGLGMARVFELVAELGGSISVGESPPGGTTVEIHLPGRVGGAVA